MPEYILARKGGAFTCAKFEGGDAPSVVYELHFNEKTSIWACSCPAGTWRKKPCKHINMLLAKLKEKTI